MESSRIFVRGLPPTLSEEEFGRHFSKPIAHTDVKFFPQRRIGYVGYKTPEEASKAVKYFNKTYLRMSKLGVEIARPIQSRGIAGNRPLVEIPQEVNAIDHFQEHEPPKKKQKIVSGRDGEEDKKLQEFLKANQRPTKAKTWADEISASIPEELPSTNADVRIDDDESADDYQELAGKKAIPSVKDSDHLREVEAGPLLASTNIDLAPMNDHDQSEHSASLVNDEDAITHGTVGKAMIRPATVSDSDWMRSRTSRLLGLLDEEEEQDIATKPVTSIATGDTSALVKRSTNEQQSQPRQSLLDEANPIVDAHHEDEAMNQDAIEQPKIQYNRLFVRNLAYSTIDSELRDYFGKYGDLEEVHVPIDPKSSKSKGFAYVQYLEHAAAKEAQAQTDGQSFQGRLLHVLPSSGKSTTALDEFSISKLPLKKQKQIKRKSEASTSTFQWNSMYMNADAVVSSVATRLGLSKAEVLDPTSSNAAVRQAHAETNIIQESKAYFTSHGVNPDAFKKGERSGTIILVKNFSYGTQAEEIKALFETHGQVKRVLLPPSGTIAIVEMENQNQGKTAFRALAYRKFKDSVLFLEKAPTDLFSGSTTPITANPGKSGKPSASELLSKEASEDSFDTATLYVRNLNFTTTNDGLRDVFKPLDGFLSARVKTKPDPKKPGQTLSMGFGFVEFRTKAQAQAAQIATDGYTLDGHILGVKASHKAVDAAGERRREDASKREAGRRTKIIIKNLPFEATRRDISELFGAYGKLRSVRVPKKFDQSTRGFAFAEFVTTQEAESAMEALTNTHLLGRRLVLNYAAEDAVDPEAEIERMQKKVSKQVDKVAIQRLTGTNRKKFNVQGNGNDGDDEF
ncbi:Multiple RNA-binding domain-containing protein 1 [Agyrium rufum]|nr:Multiple RNA-binding domain-containing protein 1 [Agyrium rufum]